VLRRFPYLRSALPRIDTHEVSRLYLEGPSGESTVVQSDTPAALMIRRIEFDALLVALAVDAGAELITGADVRPGTRAGWGGSSSTPETAAGSQPRPSSRPTAFYSVVARRLGINPGWPARALALDMMEETPRRDLRDVDPSTLWVAYGFNHAGATGERAAPEGYAYIFPKRDHVNIGIGYLLPYFRDRVDAEPYVLQRAFVDHLRERGIVVGESVRRNFTPFQIPVGGPLRRTGARPRVAGGRCGRVRERLHGPKGFITPWYRATSPPRRSPRRGAIPPRSRQTLTVVRSRGEIGAELRDSVLIQRYLFADRRRIATVIREAPRQPAMTRLILDFAIGRRSYPDVRRRIFLRAPLLAARLAVRACRRSMSAS